MPRPEGWSRRREPRRRAPSRRDSARPWAGRGPRRRRTGAGYPAATSPGTRCRARVAGLRTRAGSPRATTAGPGRASSARRPASRARRHPSSTGPRTAPPHPCRGTRAAVADVRAQPNRRVEAVAAAGEPARVAHRAQALGAASRVRPPRRHHREGQSASRGAGIHPYRRARAPLPVRRVLVGDEIPAARVQRQAEPRVRFESSSTYCWAKRRLGQQTTALTEEFIDGDAIVGDADHGAARLGMHVEHVTLDAEDLLDGRRRDQIRTEAPLKRVVKTRPTRATEASATDARSLVIALGLAAERSTRTLSRSP